jgi:hypothetical protein
VLSKIINNVSMENCIIRLIATMHRLIKSLCTGPKPTYLHSSCGRIMALALILDLPSRLVYPSHR